MRVVALEEHFVVPALIDRISPDVVARRGIPARGQTWSPLNQTDAMAEVGPERLRAMDESAVTMQVLSVVGPGADLLPPAEGPGWARDANDAMAAAIAAHPDRYAGFAHLPLTAPDAAADELERAVRQLGFCGALVSGTTDGHFLDHSSFEPILARAEALGVPIYLHPGIPDAPVRAAYYDNLPDDLSFPFAIAGWGWHADTAVHVLRLVLSGALDRHPTLQLIVGHMGEGLATMLARFDQVFGTVRKTPRSVSRTILEQVHVTTSGFTTLPLFMALLETFGADRIMYSADYPFVPGDAGGSFLKTLPVSPADLAKIAHGNADRLLRLGPDRSRASGGTS